MWGKMWVFEKEDERAGNPTRGYVKIMAIQCNGSKWVSEPYWLFFFQVIFSCPHPLLLLSNFPHL